MLSPNSTSINDLLIETVVHLPEVEARASLLETADLLNPEGLSQLLDTAASLTRTDPMQARRLSLICGELAERIDAPLLVPKATYINAQTHAVMGQLNEALALIRSASDGYRLLDAELSALRTNLGRIHVLNELGHHQKAVAVGQELLDQLTQVTDLSENMLSETTLIKGIAYQNQGVCYRMMGQYENALQAYTAAETAYQKAGVTERLADIYNNRGIILLHLGRVTEALSDFEAAAFALHEAGHTLLYAQSLINIGDAHLLLGQYARSLKALAEAHQLLHSLDMLADEYTLLLQRGDVYLVLNLYPEAIEAYREAERACRAAGVTHYHARALWGMGAVLSALTEYEEAAAALAQAEQLFMRAENIPMWCSVKLDQATLFAAQGEREKGVAAAQQAFGLVDGKGWPVQTFYAHVRLADLLQSDTAAVERHLLAAQQLSHELALPHLHYRIQRRLGRLRWRQGLTEEAQSWLKTAVNTIEQLRDTVTHEAMRISFLHDKLAAYQDLLQLYLSQDSEKDRRAAFILAEKVKSRVLVDLVTGIIDSDTVLPDDPQLAAQLHALRADLNAAYNAFLGHVGADGLTLSPPELLARAQMLEQKIGRLQQQANIPQTASAPTSTLSLDKMQAQIPQDLCLLAYHIIGDEIIAFIYQAGEIRVVREVSTVTAVQPHLHQLSLEWNRFRIGGQFVQRHITRLEKSAQQVLMALHTELIAPLIPYLPAGTDVDTPTKLLIIPHGLLHQIPFHALYNGRSYLLEQFEISYAPSVTLFTLCQQKARLPFTQALIMGVADPLIPAVDAEVTAVKQQFANATVKTGQEATIHAFRDESSNANIIHLACHGLFRADNPIFSALKLHDDWLTAADILQLNLNNSLVTLSACESGQSQIKVGDELIGLARAFLGAGATSLVVSLWIVQDETTATLMSNWYQELQQQPHSNRAAALRTAQLKLKSQYPHPYYWAPFVLIGQR
jgi:CHAT domain-containing protein/tetratricopeptide (TPR) repeat protein